MKIQHVKARYFVHRGMQGGKIMHDPWIDRLLETGVSFIVHGPVKEFKVAGREWMDLTVPYGHLHMSQSKIIDLYYLSEFWTEKMMTHRIRGMDCLFLKSISISTYLKIEY